VTSDEEQEPDHCRGEQPSGRVSLALKASSFCRIPTATVPTSLTCAPIPKLKQPRCEFTIEYEEQQGRVVTDVHEKNLGYDRLYEKAPGFAPMQMLSMR
jgi:hypothetical protein